MRKRKLIVLALLPVTLFSCDLQEERLVDSEQNPTEQTTDSPYLIDENTALSYLSGFLNPGETTKSASQMGVRSIVPIVASKVRTKGYQDLPEDYQKLFYIVNFEDDGGYALLAADSRMPSKVIYVIEQGSLSDDEFYASLSEDYMATKATMLASSTGIIYKEFDDSTEMFLDADNFVPYDASVNDCYIGNYVADSLDVDFDTYVSKETMAPINKLAVSYSTDGTRVLPSLPAVDLDSDQGLNQGTVTTNTTTSTSLLANTDNLLDFTKRWRQRSPFNDFCPKVRALLAPWKRKRALCGCFPLSVAKVMTKFKYPGSVTYNDFTVVWDSLYVSEPSFIRSRSAAALTRSIGAACGSIYFYGGTFTFPYRVVRYMNFIGFKNTEEIKYDTDKVLSMIDNDCPVIISGIPNKLRLTKSHAWTIDGYKKTKTRTDVTYYKNGQVQRTTTSYETSTMVHCNFGWGGNSDGYFTSGIFDLKDDNVEYDNANYDDYNYNGRIRIIVYEKPY